MAVFSYKASNQDGKTIKGTIDADSEQVALSLLYAKDLIPYQIIQNSNTTTEQEFVSKDFFSFIKKQNFLYQRKIPPTEISGMVRQLSVLLKAGLSLDVALQTLSTYEYSAKLKLCLAQVRDDLLKGQSFADSLQKYQNVFSQTFISMVKAGEESGTLEIVIEQYAGHLEKRIELRRKVQGALAYPLFMMLIGVVIVVFLLSYVVPQITEMFTSMDRELPLATEILISVSNFFNHWWMLALGAFLLVYCMWRMFKKTEVGQNFWYKVLLRAPLFSKVYKLMLVGRFCQTLGMLLKNDVTLLKSLKIVRTLSQNAYLTKTIDDMYEGVQQGYDLSYFLGNPLLFSALVKQMVHAGEQSGKVADMLLWLAKDCDENVASRLQVLTSLLEPLMVLVLGVIVGFVVIAIMLPIFQVSNLVV